MKNSIIDKCKLCLQNKKLCDSHIISEFLFKPGYDEIHRINELKANTGNSNYIQKGIREYLLCSDCENLISKWEDYSSILLKKMEINEKKEAVYLKNINYKYFKLFHLSILWKASIAKGNEFCNVALGPHEEKLRKKLLNEDAGQSDIYPIIGRMLIDDKKRTDGFTITKGRATNGGGVLCNSGGTVKNCIVNGNSAIEDGCGVYCFNAGTVQNCNISENTADDDGGGFYSDNGGTIQNSTIIGNSASDDGGGVYCYQGASVLNCIIKENKANDGAGGINNGILQNCLIIGNSASDDGGGILNFGTLLNCTISENSASDYAGGVIGSGETYNSIIYYNTANFYDNINGGTIKYSCSLPLPSGEGNIFLLPDFVDLNGGDYHLNEFSPCVDSGTNAFAGGDWDLDGNPRINDGIVDMGAYEFVPEPSSIIIVFFISLYFIRRKN